MVANDFWMKSKREIYWSHLDQFSCQDLRIHRNVSEWSCHCEPLGKSSPPDLFAPDDLLRLEMNASNTALVVCLLGPLFDPFLSE